MSCPVKHEKAAAGECPVQHGAGEAGVNPFNNMANDLKRNEPSPGQTRALPTQRETSTIPRTTGDGEKWVYPSAQMLFNAMRRKGYSPPEKDMDVIVGIHNSVNERAWKDILRIEGATHPECESVSLYSIRGLSNKLSPKARMWQMLGYEKPFDRHDWVVDRCGKHVDYVIDYYEDNPGPGKVIGVYLDIRPAANSMENLWDRVKASLM